MRFLVLIIIALVAYYSFYSVEQKIGVINMEKLLDIEVVTPKEKIYKGKGFSVTVPGKKSPFQILYNHAPIVSSLDAGKITIVDDKNNEIIYSWAENQMFIQAFVSETIKANSSLTYQEKIDISDLAHGTYFLEVELTDQKYGLKAEPIKFKVN